MKISFHQNATGRLFQFAKKLRRNSTSAEKVLWSYLRNGKLDGHKFRRQHPFGKYIPDFYCHEKKLIIEVDGEIHFNKEAQKRDKKRTMNLEGLGNRVIRFRNEDVEHNIQFVLAEIRKACQD